MDYQSVVHRTKGPHRISGGFQRVPYGELDVFSATWLEELTCVPKRDFQKMVSMLEADQWDLWNLPNPASGVAVTYPKDDLLFIHYLHGRRLFGNLTKEVLLQAARDEGLKGMKAEVQTLSRAWLLASVGFRTLDTDLESYWVMELRDGRQ